MGKDTKDKKDKKEKSSKKMTKEEREQAEMMQILKNCQNSMMQVFVEQTVVSDLVDENFMEAFAESPEYAEALVAFKMRFESARGKI